MVPVGWETKINDPFALPWPQIYLLQMAATSGSNSIPEAATRVLKSKACRSAVMFGDPLSPQDCSDLIRWASPPCL